MHRRSDATAAALAQETVLAHTQPLAAETVALGAALGRTLAADVTASDPLPPFPASMMVHMPGIYSVQLDASSAS